MKRESVEVFEFRGGYAAISERELFAILAAYKNGYLKKDDFRVWAALHEEGMLHPKSKVTLNRIINCKAAQAGIKAMRSGVIGRSEHRLEHLLSGIAEGRKRTVARVVLRAMAQGRLSCTESIVAIMYALRRVTQRRELKRLLPSERYARFTLRELEQLSGVARANLSRSIASLKVKGILSTVWVVKQNENQFGLLFVDGPLLTLIPGAAENRGAKQKKTTPGARNNNTPVIVLPTLKKEDPKREIQKEERNSLWTGGKTWSNHWERILARGQAMKESFVEQVA
jgi:hypothetical protein